MKKNKFVTEDSWEYFWFDTFCVIANILMEIMQKKVNKIAEWSCLS